MLLPRLYAIADASFGDPIKIAEALFDGGARLIQVRNKNAGSGELLRQVEAVLAFAPPDACVLVNDRADVARIAVAGGVHLGQDDLSVLEARLILGSSVLIGLSTHTAEQAAIAQNLPVDYIAVGPIFPTHTKENPSPVVGLEGLHEIAQRSQKPVVAIGGITLENARDVMAAGAASVAVIRDLLQGADIAARVREWVQYNQDTA